MASRSFLLVERFYADRYPSSEAGCKLFEFGVLILSQPQDIALWGVHSTGEKSVDITRFIVGSNGIWQFGVGDAHFFVDFTSNNWANHEHIDLRHSDRGVVLEKELDNWTDSLLRCLGLEEDT